MVEIDTRLRFSPGSHEQFATEYMTEIRDLVKAAESPEFDRLVERFSNYPEYLASRRALDPSPIDRVMAASAGTGVVDLARKKLSEEIHEALLMAHMAACCHLLHSSRLARSQFQRQVLVGLAQQFVQSCQGKPEDYRMRMVGKFHTMDTVRIMQLLRVLGLVTRPSQDMVQLGMGAADGTRDVLSIHLMPDIQVSSAQGGPFLSLRAEKRLPAEAIIVDADPVYAEQYEKLNEDPSNNVTAYNCDTMQALEAVSRNMARKRNFVTCLRIDHRMIPDAEAFLKQLAPCIDDDCDFVLSIGAGDTLDDFKGRVDTVAELFKALQGANLRPVLFKLHGPGSLGQQWRSLLFGNARASSYQILYCRLSGKVLGAAF
jgi:hypothetical protein